MHRHRRCLSQGSHEDQRAVFRVTLGPQVQTLTRAMTSILCRGLDHSTATEVLEVPSDFVPKIVGERIGTSAQPDRVLCPDAHERDLQSLSGSASCRDVRLGAGASGRRPAHRAQQLRLYWSGGLAAIAFSLLVTCHRELQPCRNVKTSEEISPNGQLKALTFRRLCPEEHSITTHVSMLRADETLPDGNGNVVCL